MEWSAQFLWIWFAEMRFVASHHVSLVKLAEHVTLLKAAAATPRRAKFPRAIVRNFPSIQGKLRQHPSHCKNLLSFVIDEILRSSPEGATNFVRSLRGGGKVTA